MDRVLPVKAEMLLAAQCPGWLQGRGGKSVRAGGPFIVINSYMLYHWVSPQPPKTLRTKSLCGKKLAPGLCLTRSLSFQSQLTGPRADALLMLCQLVSKLELGIGIQRCLLGTSDRPGCHMLLGTQRAASSSCFKHGE